MTCKADMTAHLMTMGLFLHGFKRPITDHRDGLLAPLL